MSSWNRRTKWRRQNYLENNKLQGKIVSNENLRRDIKESKTTKRDCQWHRNKREKVREKVVQMEGRQEGVKLILKKGKTKDWNSSCLKL